MSYPNCERLVEVEVQRQAINEFIEFLNGKDIELARWSKRYDHLQSVPSTSIESLVYQFFGIDEKQLRVERDQLFLEAKQQYPSLFNVVNTTQEDK